MPRTKQFNEEEVLQKAVEIFWKKGFHATSMDDLVKHLGINRASLYDTFGGKKQIFEKAVSKYIADNTLLINEFFSKPLSVKEGLLKFFQLVVQSSVADTDLKGCLVVNTSVESIPDDQEIVEILAGNKHNFENIFYQVLKKGQEEGEIDPQKNIKAISVYLVTLFNGLKVAARLKPDEAELNAVVKTGLAVLDT